MTPYEFLSVAVSGLALLIAGFSLAMTRRAQRKQLEFQAISAALAKKQLQKLEKDEQFTARADLTVELVKLGVSDFRFVLFNQGSAVAKEVGFAIAEDSPDNPLIARECERMLPYPALQPGQSFTLIAALHLGSAMSYMTHVKWKNPDGSGDSRDVYVSV